MIRQFTVVNKETSRTLTVNGVDELARVIGVDVKDIPKIRLYKYVVGPFQVLERKF